MWPIKITSETHTPAGKRIRWSRRIDGYARSVRSGFGRENRLCDIKRYVAENLPSAFYGCEVRIITPLHNDVGVVDPDTREFHYTS